MFQMALLLLEDNNCVGGKGGGGGGGLKWVIFSSPKNFKVKTLTFC